MAVNIRANGAEKVAAGQNEIVEEKPLEHREFTTQEPIPVILDTDIGDDIDDTWALAMMLKSPELDVRLVVSATGDTRYRAKLIAKMLEMAGRTDIPIGIGMPGKKPLDKEPQRAWVEDYELKQYPGQVYSDGIAAIIRMLRASDVPMTLICIGPLTNIAEALRRDASIARKAHFVGMQGSVDRGYGGKSEPDAEWNVKQDIASCQVAFSGDWLSRTITPIDTCERVVLRGENYRRLQESVDPALQAVLENYRIWAEVWRKGEQPLTESSVLFDTVAVHLAYSREFIEMEKIKLRVTDDGHTVRDAAGYEFDVAIDWSDLEGFHEYLSRRLLGKVVS